MVRRLNKLFIALLIVGVSLYIVLLNRENVTIFLSPSRSVTTSGGVILIAVFCIGVVISALVATYFGVKAYFRELGFLSRERQRETFFRDFLQARSFSAAGEWGKARSLWEQIVRRNPLNNIASIELARALEKTGNIREALKVLESARSRDSSNIELLFRTAEMNIASGNKTAAIDNLALILYHHPVARAAAMARDLSEDLERFEDALEYQRQYEKMKGVSATDNPTPRLMLKQALKENSADTQSVREKLLEIARLFPNFAPIYEKLSEIENERGDVDSAAGYLLKAAQMIPSTSHRRELWQQAMQLWIRHSMPERAIAAARLAAKSSNATGRLQAEVDLIQLYAALGMFDEAQKLINGFPELARTQTAPLSPEISFQLSVLEAYSLLSLGKVQDSSQILKKVCDVERQLPERNAGRISAPYSAPSPTLSTP